MVVVDGAEAEGGGGCRIEICSGEAALVPGGFRDVPQRGRVRGGGAGGPVVRGSVVDEYGSANGHVVSGRGERVNAVAAAGNYAG